MHPFRRVGARLSLALAVVVAGALAVVFAAYGARQEELGAREIRVGNSWARADLSVSSGGEVYGQIEMAGPGTLLVDGLALGGAGTPQAGK